MWWIIGGAGIALGCYILGYVMGSVITNERRNQAREEMGLEEGCYGCKEVGLPCNKTVNSERRMKMSSLRRTILRRIKNIHSGRYSWNNTGNRKSRRTKKKEK